MVNQKSTDVRFIRQLNEIIDPNIQDESFGVSELADKMNMSRKTLYRKLKSIKGQSVSRYIRNARLNKAMGLLKNESLTVAEAAYNTGFGSATYFSKCFHDYFGFPPVEVTKQTFEANNLSDSDNNKESDNKLHNFPVWYTSFIGREKEIGTINGLIKKHRIVTLTGTGGCGKTRLAYEVVAKLNNDYPDGIWFVDLAPVQTTDLVAKQLMNTLGLTEVPGADMVKTMVEGIQDKRMLILLDNCEHLLITCAEIARRLIESVSDLSLLATSREALNIAGEKVWIIPSLSLIDPSVENDMDQIGSSESVCLFTDRARLNNPGFELVERNATAVSKICHHLDGIPLAIELVASRTRYMDVNSLLTRLSERFDKISSPDRGIVDRHKTIRSAIDWSYNLLSEDEKILFRRLSVFSGGFELIAVEEVCSDEILTKDKTLDLLAQLVEKSLVQTVYHPGQKMRYKLLETIQKYGSQVLIEKGEIWVVRDRHLDYYLRMAEKAYNDQFENQSKWVVWLEMERANLLAALNYADSASSKYFSELAGYLSWFWRLKSEFTTGINLLERALTKNNKLSNTYARTLFGLGILTWATGDSQSALSFLYKSLEIRRKLKLPGEVANTLAEISEPLLHSGEHDGSLKCSEEAVEIARNLESPGLLNHCLIYYSIVLVHSKYYDKGEPLVEELLLTSESLENIYGIETALHLHGDCAVGTKDYKEGEKRYAKGIEISYKYGNLSYVTFDIQGIAFALSGQGRFAKAVRLDAAAREKFKEIGIAVDGMVGFWDEWIEAYIEGAKRKLGSDLAKQYKEEGIKMGFEKAVEYALDFDKD